MKKLKSTIVMGAVIPTALFAQERPNIIYIMTDQQTATAMSCAGNADLHTPNMDKLAKRGVRFENAYCAAPCRLVGLRVILCLPNIFPVKLTCRKNSPLNRNIRRY